MNFDESLDQYKNSIELALMEYIKSKIQNSKSLPERKLLEISNTIVQEIPFSSYLELGYALDEYDETADTIENQPAEEKINKILGSNKSNIIIKLSDIDENSDFIKLVVDYLNSLNECFKIKLYSNYLNENTKPKYHYNAIVSEKIREKIIKYLDEYGINYVNNANELTVECESRDNLYAFDKYLSRITQQEHYMVDNMKEASKNPKNVTSYDLARTVKPRFDQTQMPKAGAFDKDTKGRLKKKNPDDRRAMKHKGRAYESEEKFILDEAIMGMTAIPFISRLQALAGLESSAQTEIAENEELNESFHYTEALRLIEELDESIAYLTPNELKTVTNSLKKLLSKVY